MSLKSRLLKSSLLQGFVKLAIKLTPKKLVKSVANVVLKGIAEFSEITYDLDARTAYVNVTLYGEKEPIEVALDGFEIQDDDDNKYKFILHKAESNKPWMNNILLRIVGKAWDIPPVPQYQDEVDFVASLIKGESPVKEPEAIPEPDADTMEQATKLA